MDRKLVIWGASGHALVVADIIRLQGDYEIFGFLDDVNPDRHKREFCGAAIIGGKEALDIIRKKGVGHIIFGFGDNAARLKLSGLAEEKGFILACAIHPSAVKASGVSIGSGSVVCAGAVINPGAKIGRSVIINTSATIDHECMIGDATHVGPGACLGGKVNIGEEAWIGIGTTIKDRVKIGARSVIGAGSLILEDIPEGVLAYGRPAKVIKEIKEDGV